MPKKAPVKKASAKKARPPAGLLPEAAPLAEWTVLIYLAGDNDLDYFGGKDLMEMKKIGSSDRIHIIAQRDTATPGVPTCRYRLQKGTPLEDDVIPGGQLRETNTGDPKELQKFLEWGIENYPARKTMAVLWNHGSGWDDRDVYKAVTDMGLTTVKVEAVPGVRKRASESPPVPVAWRVRRSAARTAGRGPFFISKEAVRQEDIGGQRKAIAFDEEAQDFLDNVEMKRAFEAARKKLGGPFAIIGMDACLMSMLEVGMQLKDCGQLFCGSQELEPSQGWPYDEILTRLADKPEMSGEELCKVIVTQFVASFKDRPVTQSAYTFNDLPAVQKAVDQLGYWLADGYLQQDDLVIAAVDRASREAQRFQYDPEGYADIWDFCEKLSRLLPKCADLCERVHQALTHCVFANSALHEQVKRSRGLSIYLPTGKVSPLYRTLESGRSGWARFLDRKHFQFDLPGTRRSRPTMATRSIVAKEASPAVSADFTITFRTLGHPGFPVRTSDKALYPIALSWNRMLGWDRGRFGDEDSERKRWRKFGVESFQAIARSGLHGATPDTKKKQEAKQKADTIAFMEAVAKSGIIQVEIPWTQEAVGYSARIFPWERLFATATKTTREESAIPCTVVRRLCGLRNARPTWTGERVFVVTEEAEKQGFDFDSEHKAFVACDSTGSKPVKIDHLDSLGEKLKKAKISQMHLVFVYGEGDDHQAIRSADTKRWHEQADEQAGKLAALKPELLILSSCDTGKRLAPLAVKSGIPFALGFHGYVQDASLPAFFASFYEQLKAQSGPIAALRTALQINKRQPSPDDLGFVCLWSSEDMLDLHSQSMDKRKREAPARPAAKLARMIPEAGLDKAIITHCSIEKTLNYSILHNQSGGVFQKFTVEKRKSGRVKPLQVTVRLVSGVDDPAECRFFVRLGDGADEEVQDLAKRVVLPLGSQLMRQRGESVLATLEVSIMCGGVQILHNLEAIRILPCDEWSDSELGRHLLPSFIFPRDPAVRELITTAQPYLRALRDDPHVGFDGYQDGVPRSVLLQLRATWAAIQHDHQLDYINPPPSYTRSSQRLRVPEEIFRSGRGTCIELSLFLAAVWEHIGIDAVIFLTPGHAFVGVWTDMVARSRIIEDFEKMRDLAEKKEPVMVAQEGLSSGADSLLREIRARSRDASQEDTPRQAVKKPHPWLLTQPHHLAAIRLAVEQGSMVPLESTYIPKRKSFSDALRDASDLLSRLHPLDFDGMLDIRVARENGITPMAIINHGISA